MQYSSTVYTVEMLILLYQCNMNFITVKSTAVLSKYFGETEATLRRLFQKARNAAPCILFFDEFDAIAHNRFEHTSHF